MKLGIITDIHNNLIALNAVLDYFTEQECDKIICCGDIIGIGPYPEETVQRIMAVENLIAVKGNHDGYLVDGMPTVFPNEEMMDYGEIFDYSKIQCSRLEIYGVEDYLTDYYVSGDNLQEAMQKIKECNEQELFYSFYYSDSVETNEICELVKCLNDDKFFY